MKIGDLLKTKDRGVSFEFFPPRTEKGREKLKRTASELAAFKPLYVSVTYGAGGTTQDKTRETALSLKREAGLNVMPHLTCIGAKKAPIKSLLDEYTKDGFDNILALRGDPPKDIKDFDVSKGEFRHAVDMVKFIKGAGGFSIGVGVYPEGHLESPSLEADLEYAKQKIDAGADFCITQMFFDNTYFYRFRDLAAKEGVRIPIIAAIMPISNFDKAKEFASFCGATVPSRIEERMSHVLDKPEEMAKVGTDIAAQQCMDLKKNGVKFFHFYALNRARAIKETIEKSAVLLD